MPLFAEEGVDAGALMRSCLTQLFACGTIVGTIGVMGTIGVRSSMASVPGLLEHSVMARPLRIEYPGALYHLTSRGDRQEAIFDDDQDRTAFLNVLSEVVSRFSWRCHAYCLMGN